MSRLRIAPPSRSGTSGSPANTPVVPQGEEREGIAKPQEAFAPEVVAGALADSAESPRLKRDDSKASSFRNGTTDNEKALSKSNTSRLPSVFSKEKKNRSLTLSPYVCEETLELIGTEPPLLKVTVDRTQQHTISWHEDIFETPGDEEPALPVGRCNLYLYPSIRTDLEPRGYRPSDAGIRVLKKMIKALALTTHQLNEPDEVGAFAIHALVVCNTPESLEISMELFEEQPHLMTQVHVKHRAGFPLFSGESSLHIFAVNQHEDLFCRFLDLAVDKLDPDELEALLRSQCTGVFFHSLPMYHYGSTALSYASVFEMRRAIVKLLETQYVSFNSRADGCINTGFMPMHAVVANGNMAMFDFLTEQLPHEWRADVHQITKKGAISRAKHLRSLTGMQLAAKLGDHKSFRHILRKQCEVNWVWGPVTEFSLNLQGIDSGGEGGGDIMELVTRMDASRDTQEMLLDTFMNGFIYRLFTQKWTKYGRKLYYARLSLDFMLLVLLIHVSFYLKYHTFADNVVLVECAAMLGIMVVILEEEIRTAYLFTLNEQGTGDASLSLREKFQLGWEFSKLHHVHVQIVGMASALVVIILLLGWTLPIPSEQEPYNNGTVAVPLRQLLEEDEHHARGLKGLSIGSSSGAIYSDKTIYDEGPWAVVWMFLVLAQMALICHFVIILFKPSPKIHVLLLSIMNMLLNDVTNFLKVFLLVLFTFLCCFWTLYPRSGDNLFPIADAFDQPYTALKAIIQLSLIGEPFSINLKALFAVQPYMSWWMFLAMYAWLLLYMFFIIMTLILLLNMLIAMLTHTFDHVRDEATLQSRLSFARCIIKQELVAESFGLPTKVGELKPDGRYVFTFRSVQHRSDEVSEDGYVGDLDEGGADPFQDPKPMGVPGIAYQLDQLQAIMAANQEKILRKLYPEDYPEAQNPLDIPELKSLKRVVVKNDQSATPVESLDADH